MSECIQAHALTKAYGLRPVLRGIDLRLMAGEVMALFGPNGAGKSTLLRVLASLLRPSGGGLQVAGHPLPAQAEAARARIGAVLHSPLAYLELTALENVRFAADLYGVADGEERARRLLERLGLSRRLNEPVRGFSRGMLQRLAVARALVHEPAVLILDEPYTGLDPAGADLLDAVIREQAQSGRGVLLTSHDLERALRVADRVAILARGRIAVDEPTPGMTTDQLRARYREALQ